MAGTAASSPVRLRTRALLIAGLVAACAAAAAMFITLQGAAPEAAPGAGHAARGSALLPSASATEDHADARDAATDAALGPYIAGLEARLAARPDDGEAWLLLARSCMSAGRNDQALDAYAHASRLEPRNVDLMIEYANGVARAHGRRLAGEPERLIAAALALEPDNRNALALAGAADLQAGRRDAAVAHWSKLLATLPDDAPGRERLVGLIARARGETPPRSATTIRGSVILAAPLAAKLGPNDTLFVFARAVQGPAMPLAVLRTTPSSWPATFTLDDSLRMAPGLLLSQHRRVDLVARISHSGNAAAQPGDLEGRVDNVALGTGDVRIVIDRIAER